MALEGKDKEYKMHRLQSLTSLGWVHTQDRIKYNTSLRSKANSHK
jgi:hypothetical protein